jgi:hypothetical protein
MSSELTLLELASAAKKIGFESCVVTELALVAQLNSSLGYIITLDVIHAMRYYCQ